MLSQISFVIIPVNSVNNGFMMQVGEHVPSVCAGDFCLIIVFMRDMHHLIICADSKSLLKGVAVSELI